MHFSCPGRGTPRKRWQLLPLLSFAHLLGLGLFLGGPVLPGNLLSSGIAHAQSTVIYIANCSTDTELQNALSEATGGETIRFRCGGDIRLTKTLTIGVNLTLDGTGQKVSLDGQNQVRVITVKSGVTAWLEALTITQGSTGSTPKTNGGSIYNSGTLTISDSTITKNSVVPEFGGGIYNGGTLTICDSSLTDNLAAQGGGIYNARGQVTISDSSISNNKAAKDGSGVYNTDKGTVVIRRSVLKNNQPNNCAHPGSITDGGGNNSSDNSCGF